MQNEAESQGVCGCTRDGKNLWEPVDRPYVKRRKFAKQKIEIQSKSEVRSELLEADRSRDFTSLFIN